MFYSCTIYPPIVYVGSIFFTFSPVHVFSCFLGSIHPSEAGDGSPARHLQLASCLHFSGGEKRWTSGKTLRTSLLFALPETRYRWARVEEFTISLLFALQNGSNNRNRVNSLSLSLVLEKAMVPHSSTLAWKNIHLKVIVMAIVKLIIMAKKN